MKPPRWPCQEMFGDRERDEDVEARARSAAAADVAADLLAPPPAARPSARRSRRRRRGWPTARPASQQHERRAGQPRDQVEREEPDPAQRPSRAAGPRNHSASMLKPMCQSSMWVNIAVTSCHQAPSATPGDPAAVATWLQTLGPATQVVAAGLSAVAAAGRAAAPAGRAACCRCQPVARIDSQTATFVRDQHDRGQPRVGRPAARRTASRPARVVFAPSATQFGALEAHRRVAHAVRADRPVAALAADVGLPVGVPVAGRHPGSRSSGVSAQRSGCPSISTDSMTTGSTGRSPAAGRGGADRVDHVAAGLVGDLAEDRVLACSATASAPTVMKNCEPLVPGPALAIASR